ncbi:MAG: 3'-5' exonuclease domain-containing protein 2 [Bacteroidaceae bacterium]|nr:3'-5' exonuclease domain-containing protein 2 [Bacteroidaceae bacterium]
MRIIKEAFDKKEIGALPVASFEGRIIIVQSETESDKAVWYLLSQQILGIDTETRPSFRKGQTHQVALLQVSTVDTCFLFRLNMIGITESIKRLLEDCSVIKVGLSLKDDMHQLSKRADFTPGMFIELQHEVKKIGIKDMSLQKIYANLFSKRISKGQQLSNWEADTLTPQQKAYAATDAWACIMIYNELNELKRNGYSIDKIEN